MPDDLPVAKKCLLEILLGRGYKARRPKLRIFLLSSTTKVEHSLTECRWTLSKNTIAELTQKAHIFVCCPRNSAKKGVFFVQPDVTIMHSRPLQNSLQDYGANHHGQSINERSTRERRQMAILDVLLMAGWLAHKIRKLESAEAARYNSFQGTT